MRIPLASSRAFLQPYRHRGQQRASFQIMSTNQELVEQRLAVARAKRHIHQQAMDDIHARNMKLKDELRWKNKNSMYAIKLTVDEELRQILQLNGREKRGRVFLAQGSNGTMSLHGLKNELHTFFRALRKSTYLLSASLPVLPVQSNLSIDSKEILQPSDSWILDNDEHVRESFAKANDLFQQLGEDILPRPTLLLHVSKDPNAPPPPPPPPYLEQMSNPVDSPSQTMISFYAFPPSGILNPEDFGQTLRKLWKPFSALGRVYVAHEGVNAQMSVPTNVLANFRECCHSIPELGQFIENGINIDPVSISNKDFAVAGVPINGKEAPPFNALHIRVRKQVVVDGLDQPLNWQSAGYDMPPLEWHGILKERQTSTPSNTHQPILLDCRNSFETNVGKFDGAEPLETTTFRETWNVMKDRLKDCPKDTPIMTYCTGGIRCVKVGAYLTQELGFTNVARLAGGIIAYDRILNEQAPDETPLFKGTNFVFDGRLGRAITDDAMATCVTCGSQTSRVTNCRNENCHQRMIQCETCKTNYHGTCSEACKQRIQNGGITMRKAISKTADDNDAEPTPIFQSLEEYSVGHSSPPPSFYHEIESNTRVLMPSGAHMVSGASQGRWLTQLASMTREGRILELGTFTGYATACFLEGAANAGDCINYLGVSGSRRGGGPYVMSLERDQRAMNIAISHLRVMAEHGVGEGGAEAACALRNNQEVPVINEAMVSLNYGKAGCDVIHVTDALATVEEMAEGKGDLQPAPFDLVFVDADKTRMVEYVEALVCNDRLLKKGGLIVVDNVLWKGLVLEASTGDFSSQYGDDTNNDDEQIRRNRRARKLATKMHRFNCEIIKDDRVEVIILPMRDGLSVIRKR